MRIAMVAPLTEPVPPSLYGGTERVVSLLTEELVRRGHAVMLFTSEVCRTSPELVARCARRLRLDPEVTDHRAYAMTQLGAVYRRAREFDLVHTHAVASSTGCREARWSAAAGRANGTGRGGADGRG